MRAIYVCSSEAGAGKTMLAVSLASQLQNSGLTVGFIKAGMPRATDAIDGGDAGFVKQALNCKESLELLAPLRLDYSGKMALAGRTNAIDLLQEAFAEVARGKDVVIVEGGSTLDEGADLGIAAAQVVSRLSARALLVSGYRAQATVNNFVAAKKSLGDALASVVVNGIPNAQQRFFSLQVEPELRREGAVLVGSLPQVRALAAVSVDEAVRHLAGEVLCCPDKMDNMVENIVIGSIQFDDAKAYFERKAKKLVVACGGRPDMQLAALASDTSGLVLSGNTYPDPYVLSRAKEVGVPVILVKDDTASVIDDLAPLFERARFRQLAKLDTARNLVFEHLDWPTFLGSMGLADSEA
jgi:BioD-like phosphotransacetylase family protein